MAWVKGSGDKIGIWGRERGNVQHTYRRLKRSKRKSENTVIQSDRKEANKEKSDKRGSNYFDREDLLADV